jgi:hypothetical protein
MYNISGYGLEIYKTIQIVSLDGSTLDLPFIRNPYLKRFNFGYTTIGPFIVIQGGKIYTKENVPKFLNDIIVFHVESESIVPFQSTQGIYMPYKQLHIVFYSNNKLYLQGGITDQSYKNNLFYSINILTEEVESL